MKIILVRYWKTLIAVKFSLLVKIKKRISIAIFAPLITLTASSIPLSADDAAKTTQQIIEKAQNNESQSLIVEFNHQSVTEMINAKRLASGAMYDREEDTKEKTRAYALLRENVFPHGRLGNAYVIQEFSTFPLALVAIPSYKALEQILSHPLVRTVSENKESTVTLY